MRNDDAREALNRVMSRVRAFTRGTTTETKVREAVEFALRTALTEKNAENARLREERDELRKGANMALRWLSEWRPGDDAYNILRAHECLCSSLSITDDAALSQDDTTEGEKP